MRLMKFLSVLLISGLCAISCASVAQKEMPYIDITDSSKFVLLPTEGIERAMDMVQFFSYEFGGQSYFFNSWVKANENEIEMAFFNELGTNMGELSYRNGLVNFSSPVFQKSVMQYIKPEYIIADFQLCFYDQFLLSNSLNDIGLVLEVNDGNRRVFSGNEVLIDIKKTENTVKLVNNLRGYAFGLEGDFN